jgi:LPS sulfotransferase NodH
MSSRPSAARFVIFAAPRTGSNLLCSLLNAHPHILCHHGVFNPQGIHHARDRSDLAEVLGTITERDADPLSFIERVWQTVGREAAVGFKINRGEDPFASDMLLRDPSVRKIMLKRRNRVRAYVSEKLAQITGVWESYDKSETAEQPSLQVDAQALQKHAQNNAVYYAQMESVLRVTGQDWLETHYEALGDWDEIARILSYLGVAANAPLKAACRKRGADDLSTVIANLPELSEALRNTPLFQDIQGRDVPDIHSHQPII